MPAINLSSSERPLPRTSALITFALLYAPLQLAACATMPPAVHVKTIGRVQPAWEQRVSKLATHPRKLAEQAETVAVYLGALPTGLSLAPDGSLLLSPGAQRKYQLLGEIRADYHSHTNEGWKNVLWTWEHKSQRRDALCAVQAPLKLLTLGLWNILPIAWPCMAEVPDEPHLRRRDLVDGIKRGTKALGGDFAVLVVDRPRRIVAYALRTRH